MLWRALIPLLILGLDASIPVQGASSTADREEFFERRIRPVLANNCFACHTDSRLGGLQLDSRQSILKGGNSGPAIVPGEPRKSLLLQAVSGTHERLKMPLEGELTEQEIGDLRTWVKDGDAEGPVKSPQSQALRARS